MDRERILFNLEENCLRSRAIGGSLGYLASLALYHPFDSAEMAMCGASILLISSISSNISRKYFSSKQSRLHPQYSKDITDWYNLRQPNLF